MKIKTYMLALRIIAIAQAIIAPGLIVLGVFIRNQKIKNVGIWWCALIAVDTGRVYHLYQSLLLEDLEEEVLEQQIKL